MTKRWEVNRPLVAGCTVVTFVLTVITVCLRWATVGTHHEHRLHAIPSIAAFVVLALFAVPAAVWLLIELASKLPGWVRYVRQNPPIKRVTVHNANSRIDQRIHAAHEAFVRGDIDQEELGHRVIGLLKHEKDFQ
jgi:hypothetical protein